MSKPAYTPTAAQIRMACEEIRRGWTATEKRKRAGTNSRKRVEVAEVKAPREDRALQL